MRKERKLDPAPGPDQSCLEVGRRYELKFLGRDGQEMVNVDATYVFRGTENGRHNFSVEFKSGGPSYPLTLEESLFDMGKLGKAGVVTIPETNGKKSSSLGS